MQFVCVEDPDRNMDYLSADAARAYIEMTHEAYYGRMPEEFGTTITGTFFDEPTLYRAEGRCWTPSFNDDFARAYGSSPTLLYPALWYDIGPETGFGPERDVLAAGRAVRGGLSQARQRVEPVARNAGHRTSGQRGARESGRHVGRPDEVFQIPRHSRASTRSAATGRPSGSTR